MSTEQPPDPASAVPPLLGGSDFWRTKTWQELAAEQGVEPVQDLDKFLEEVQGVWPEDETADEFIAAVRAWRREGRKDALMPAVVVGAVGAGAALGPGTAIPPGPALAEVRTLPLRPDLVSQVGRGQRGSPPQRAAHRNGRCLDCGNGPDPGCSSGDPQPQRLRQRVQSDRNFGGTAVRGNNRL